MRDFPLDDIDILNIIEALEQVGADYGFDSESRSLISRLKEELEYRGQNESLCM